MSFSLERLVALAAVQNQQAIFVRVAERLLRGLYEHDNWPGDDLIPCVRLPFFSRYCRRRSAKRLKRRRSSSLRTAWASPLRVPTSTQTRSARVTAV
jgi:hypothetical protein